MTIQDKLYSQIKSYGWHNILKGFMLSTEFDNILNELTSLLDDNRRFTPKLKDIFNAFSICKYDNLKVVMIVDNPLKSIANTGIALASNDNKIKSIKLKHLEKAFGSLITDNSLSYLGKQGVLLLNVSLTTDLERNTKKHINIWKPFMIYLLDMLSKEDKYIFVFIGEDSTQYKHFIKNNTYFVLEDFPDKLYLDWDYQDVFNKINNIIDTPIDW